MNSVPDPEWVRHAIWWQVFPLGACGAEAVQLSGDEPVRHRLRTLLGWLDYAIELGCSGIILGPVFHSFSHGYDTIDYYVIDPRLGVRADLEDLIQAAHERGLKVMLDGVFNHMGVDNPWFSDAIAHGPGSPQEAFFRLTWPQGAGPGTRPDYANFEGHTGLIALNHDNPAVVDFVTDVMCHWLAAGIDGWRLDAAYAVPAEFWAQVLPRVRERFPHAYLMGEVIHGEYPEFVTATGMHAVTQYELWKAIWSSINDRNFHELQWALRRHDECVRTFVPQTFIGNHDVTRIASRITEQAHLTHAIVTLFTVPGTPSIYYGDEQGYHGVKEERLGGDDQIRPVLPESPDAFSGLGRWVYDRYVELIGVRRRHPWLHDARIHIRQVTNDVLVYEAIARDPHDPVDSVGPAKAAHAPQPPPTPPVVGARPGLLVVLNVGDTPVDIEGQGIRDIVAGSGSWRQGPGRARQLSVPAHDWVVAATGA